MRILLSASWLLACSFFPVTSGAQSYESTNVVSVRELSIPPRALRAFQLGNSLLAQKDAAGSLRHFQPAIAEFGNYYEAYCQEGEAFLKLSRVSEAEQSFRKAIELSKEHYSPALLALGAVLDSQQKFAEAESVIRKGLDIEKTSWSGHYYLGVALFGLNRLEESEESVREALRQKPDSMEALRLLVDIHSRERNYRALLDDLDAYLKLDPDGPTSVRVKALREAAQRALTESDDTSAFARPQS